MPTGSVSPSASGLNSNQVSATLKPPSLSSSNGNHLDPQHRFLAAPSPDVFAGAVSQRSMRSATGVTSLHQQSTRRTLRNINAIRFLRSIKVDGEPHAFPEADEHASLVSSQQQQQQHLQLPPSSSSQSSSLENENLLQPMLAQKKLSSGFADMSGSSPPLPTGMDLEADKGAFLLQEIGHQRQSDSICCERALSRGNVTPMEVHHHGSLSSNESPTRVQHDINVIPPTPTLPSTESSKYHHHAYNHAHITEIDEHGDPLPFFQSQEDLSPNSTRSPRRTSGATAAVGADHSRLHHANHHHYYQPYHAVPTRSPPRSGPHREVVRVHEPSVRFRHQREDDLRFESGDQDISSKSFRLRHASQRDNGSVAGFAQPFMQDDPVFASGGRSGTISESREISFCDLLVVTANALCRSFTDNHHQHPHVTATGSHQLTQNQSLVISSPQHGSSANGKSHQRHNQGEIEIRLYEYDPEKLDSPSFLQSVNRCPVVMPSYSVTVLGYYDPSSAKKLLNDQFKERFPDIQLTFTKMRSLKREMKKIALKCGLDLWCIAQSYVFFEKLILKHYIKKPNRKLCAGACLLLSAKLNDIRKCKIPTLIQEIESTFRIDKEDLLTCEFNTFLALDFTLMVGDCEVIPHLLRLIEQQHQSTGTMALNSTANFPLHQLGTSPTANSYALLQQHMAQHGHVRIMPPNVAAPTSTPSALVTSSGNGSSYHSMAIVPMNNCSVIPYAGKFSSNS